MVTYLTKAVSAWFMGFIPLAEIYVAIPFALALGMDEVSAVFWSVLGNLTPVVLISLLYDRFMQVPWVARRFRRMVSERFAQVVNRYGVGIVLLVTPWIGVWAVSVTARVIGMSSRRLIATASVSVIVYAVALTALIRTGSNLLG